MRIVFKGRFFSSQRIWFETFSSIEDVAAVETKADSVEIQANPIALDGKYLQCYRQESLLSKIDCVEDLMQTFSSTTRNIVPGTVQRH